MKANNKSVMNWSIFRRVQAAPSGPLAILIIIFGRVYPDIRSVARDVIRLAKRPHVASDIFRVGEVNECVRVYDVGCEIFFYRCYLHMLGACNGAEWVRQYFCSKYYRVRNMSLAVCVRHTHKNHTTCTRGTARMGVFGLEWRCGNTGYILSITQTQRAQNPFTRHIQQRVSCCALVTRRTNCIRGVQSCRAFQCGFICDISMLGH